MGRRGPMWDAASLAVAAIAMSVLLTAVAQGDGSGIRRSMAYAASGGTASAMSGSAPAASVYVHPMPDPVRIVIPAIEVDAGIVPLGLQANGDMETPRYGMVGWYELGPVPGAAGPAVIAAHVDTTRRPDVFYHLKDLAPGDEILIHDASGDVATFAVDSLEEQLKGELAQERIWNDTAEPVIRLITCSGEFDHRTGHYVSNLIVYGHLVR
jgi:hypothetical protein